LHFIYIFTKMYFVLLKITSSVIQVIVAKIDNYLADNRMVQVLQMQSISLQPSGDCQVYLHLPCGSAALPG
jgi:hypothetical protein